MVRSGVAVLYALDITVDIIVSSYFHCVKHFYLHFALLLTLPSVLVGFHCSMCCWTNWVLHNIFQPTSSR